MAATQQEQHLEPVSNEFWWLTDPEQIIKISEATSVYDKAPVVIDVPLKTMFEKVAQPDLSSRVKMGTCFMTGPCYGNKTKANVEYIEICVLDADSSFDENMNIVEGAPDPVKVHNVLKNFNISHVLYTTYSHGYKGNRYRILFPLPAKTEFELKAATTYFAEILQGEGLPFVLTPESFKWQQPWQYTRLKKEDSPFWSAMHWGYTINPRRVEAYYDLSNELSARLPPQEFGEVEEDQFALSGQISKYIGIEPQLILHGYTFKGQSHQRMPDGEMKLVQRWWKPGADKNEAPGVIVFTLGTKKFCYSHYSNDPLANGKANDAWGTFTLLNGMKGADKNTVMAELIREVNEHVARELNENFPRIMISGTDFKIGNIYDEEAGGRTYKYMSKDSFMNYMLSEPPTWRMQQDGETGNVVTKPVKRGEFWLAEGKMPKYNGIRYHPVPLGKEVAREIPEGERTYFNLFHGWGLEPEPGRWDLLHWHLLYAICGGHEDEYEYLLDWFAHLVQVPQEKPEVALVIQGKKAWGKSSVFSRLIRCFGPNTMVLTTPKQLTGDFNGHLQNKIAVLVEESFWSGDPRAEGPLKTLITDEEATYEAKRENAVAGKSYVRVVMITNNDWAVPVSQDERRYFVPSITDASFKMNQTKEKNPRGDFFPFLFEEMDTGGVAAFYHDMMKRNIKGKNIRNAPVTAKMSRQLAHTLVKEEAWLYDVLSTGEIRQKEGLSTRFQSMGTTIKIDLLEQSMGEYLPPHERQKSMVNRIQNFLTNKLPNTARLINGPTGTYVRLASLEACRQDYQAEAKIKAVWPEFDQNLTV